MQTAIAIDTETTGLLVPCCFPKDMQPRIIEIYAALFNLETGNVIEEIEEYVNPYVSIPRKITQLTGITNQDVAGAPSWERVSHSIRALSEQSLTVIAHNAAFDREVIGWNCELYDIPKLFNNHDWICTVVETQWIENKNMKMRDVYEYLFDEPLEQKHRAKDDVLALIKIATQLHQLGGLLA